MNAPPPATLRPVVAALVAALLAPPAGCSQRSDDARPPLDEDLRVKAMTFNIRYGSANDGANRWSRRRELVRDAIRRCAADFVGLQEAQPQQIAYLRRHLDGYAMVARSREVSPRAGEATPIFYRRRRWHLDARRRGTFWLSDRPQQPGSKTWGNVCPRIVTWGRFVDSKTRRGVYVYNTHFSHMSKTARRKSAALLAARVAARKPPEPVLVMGDFNAGEASRPIRHLKGEGPGAPLRLVDTFRVLHPKAKNVGTFGGFTGRTSGGKIDYVFTLPQTQVREATIVRDQRGGRYPSDHYPVTAEVVFPAETSSATTRPASRPAPAPGRGG